MRVNPHLLASLVSVLLAVVVLPGRAWSAPSDETSPQADAPAPLLFRRIRFLAERMEELARDRDIGIPMESEEFERLLTVLRTATRGSRTPLAASVVACEYSARLDGDRLVGDPSSFWKIVHRPQGETLLPLDPCGLAIEGANWAAPKPQPVTLGLGTDGKLRVLVERDGKLQFGWSLRGDRHPTGAIDFQLELPRCPTIRLVLDLPEKMVPEPEHGVVAEESAIAGGLRRWRIELGGHHHLVLRLVPSGVAADERHLPLVRQVLEYRFSQRGLEVFAQLELDVHREPLRRVRLAVDRRLKLVTARCDGQPLDWSLAADSDKRTARVELELAQPIEGPGRKLEVVAWAPLQIGRRWRLPGIRPEKMFWQEGLATLLVPAPLMLQQLIPVDCRQSRSGPLPAPEKGELVQLQCFSPGATAEVFLARPKAVMQIDSGTSVELGGGQINGQVKAVFRLGGGERFVLEADVGRKWLIDSVLGPAVADWHLEQGPGQAQKLTIRLSRALSPSHPVRLSISGRQLHSPLGRQLTGDDLVPLRFPDQRGGRNRVAVRAAEPYQLRLGGTERLARIKPRDLDPADLELFARPPGSLLFVDDAGAGRLRVSLERGKPRYRAAVQLRATVSGELLWESYSISCRPQAAHVDRLLVYFSIRRKAPLHWTLAGQLAGQLTARRLSSIEQTAAGLPSAGEAWEVLPEIPKSGPFEVRTSRTTALTAEAPISLAWLPDATGGRADLAVNCADSTVVQVRGNRLLPVPPQTPPADRCQTIRAAYRYDPSRPVESADEAAVTVGACQSSGAVSSAWVWNCRLESYYQADGTGRHLADYRLESAGIKQLRLSLPPPGTAGDLRGIWVNDARAVWQPLGDDSANRIAIDLPQGVRFPVVSVHFVTSGRRLGITDWLRRPLPKADVPVLVQHWTVWLPPGYESLDPHVCWHAGQAPERTLAQRLFGPLGRAAEGRPFDPLRVDDWSTAIGRQPGRRAAQQRALQLPQMLGEISTNSGAGEDDPDWGTLLGRKSIEGLELALLLDRRALALAGLDPGTALKPVAAEDTLARGIALLEQASLALLVHSDAILLTSASDAAICRGCLESLGEGPLWWVRPGGLAERLQRAAAGRAEAGLVTVEAWRRDPAQPKTPWTQSHLSGHEVGQTPGWTAYRLEGPAAAPARLRIAHSPTMRMLRWTTFLLVLALAWWKAAERPLLLMMLAGVLAVAALLVPVSWLPVTSGGLLALLFCLALRLIRRRREADKADSDQTVRSSQAGQAATQVIIVLLALAAQIGPLAATATAAAEPAPPAAEPRTYDVFVPVDKQKNHTGGKYYVSRELYNELHRRAATLTEKPQGWLLIGATYRVVSWQATPQRLVPTELKAIFDLVVFDDSVRVRVPLGLEGANLLPEGAQLDGRVIQPEWDRRGGSLVFDVPQGAQTRRRYRLELSLQPSLRTNQAVTGFDLAIPRLASSRLELDVPAGAGTIEVPTASGVVSSGGQPTRLVAQLGPVDRLSVQWQEGATLDVQQLLWMKVQPGSVVLDAKFAFKIVQGPVRQLQLDADPRLRLLPLRGNDSLIAEVQRLPGRPETIRLKFARPLADQDVLELSFQLTGASGMGRLRLPRLRASGARTTKRWMAVSVHEDLEILKEVSDRLEVVTPPDFATAWGTADVQPQSAYALNSAEPAWSMSTRPLKTQTTVDQSLVLSFGPESLQVRFDAQLETISGSSFQYRLSVPAELEVEKVSVLEDGVERLARCAMAPNGAITVFLNRPVAAKQQLVLEGRLPAPKQGKITLPEIRIDTAQLQSSTIELFRRPEVLVEFAQVAGLIEVEPSGVDASKADLGRPIKAFSAEGPQVAKAVVTIAPNRPKVSAQQITYLRREGESWQAAVDLTIKAAGGLVDQITLDVPAQWNGPYKTEPPTLEVIRPEDQPGRLIVRPRSAISDSLRFTVSGPLSTEPAEKLGVPEVRLQQADELAHLVVLPTLLEAGPIAWETRGLESTELPEDLGEPAAAAGLPIAYRVVGKHFRAVLEPARRPGRIAQVHLADIRVAWQADGTCHGVASFDVEPAGLSSCPLNVPAGYRLVHVSVAGMPSTPLPPDDAAAGQGDAAAAAGRGQGRFRLRLGPRELTQRVNVVYTGSLAEAGASGRRRFDSPTLGELPVRQTLWTVSGPSPYKRADPTETEMVSPLQQELIRLGSIAGVVGAVLEAPLDASEEMVRWYATWARRLETSRRRLLRELLQAGRGNLAQTARAELISVGRQQTQLAARLGVADMPAKLSAQTLLEDSPAGLWDWTLDGPRSTTLCALKSESDSIVLSYSREEAGSLRYRLAAAAAAVVLVVLGLVGVRRRTWLGLTRRWPHLLGVLAGLAWWLWFWPSILGWVLVLVSLVACIRSGLQLRRQPGSSIVRLS